MSTSTCETLRRRLTRPIAMDKRHFIAPPEGTFDFGRTDMWVDLCYDVDNLSLSFQFLYYLVSSFIRSLPPSLDNFEWHDVGVFS